MRAILNKQWKLNGFGRYLSLAVMLVCLTACSSIPLFGSKSTGPLYQIVLASDVPAGISVTPAEMEYTRMVIENRLKAMRIAGAKITLNDSQQILVALPTSAVQDLQPVLAAIKSTGLLELVEMGSAHPAEGTVIQTDFWSAGAGSNGIVAVTPTPAEGSAAPAVYHTIMTGTSLDTVKVESGAALGTSGYVISFTLKPEAVVLFADYTGSHIGQTLAIVMDKKVISAPTINARIDKGAGYIEGNFSLDSANALAIVLKSGPLPVPLSVVESTITSPGSK
jgi:preprotein translocase subunit SecD